MDDTDDMARDLDDALSLTTRRITGDDDAPARPGQVAMARDVLEAMMTTGHLAGIGPTGVGKSVAVGLPAMLTAARRGQRTLISTESKALQSQLIDKDLPLMAEVVRDVTGVEPVTGVHKGFANFGCPMQALSALRETADRIGQTVPEVPNAAGARAFLRQVVSDAAEWASDRNNSAAFEEPVGIGSSSTLRDLFELADWVLAEASAGKDADRSACPMADGEWARVSIGSDECAGSDCPLVALCPARAARERVQEADVVVTNHALLSVQSATGLPAALGGKTTGWYDHVVVDEAHALPGSVRSAGERSISGARVRRILTRMGHCQSVPGPVQASLSRRAQVVASMVDATLTRANSSPGTQLTIEPDTDWLADIGDMLQSWTTEVRASIQTRGNLPVAEKIRLGRLRSAVNALHGDISRCVDPDAPVARWVQTDTVGGRTRATLKVSPVEVDGLLRRNLYMLADDSLDPDRPPSVCMVSATLPDGFTRDAGLDTGVTKYETPLQQAYDDSMLYLPRLAEDELGRVADKSGGRWRMDVGKHRDWVAAELPGLVAASGGRALVLSATSANGKAYVEALRRAGLGVNIHSQWEGADTRQVVARWREETASVLVGTRSLMTGVDAKGETCSLVVIDRPPRNPAGIVDDARVAALQRSEGLGVWQARDAVYAADAALLLAQAAGRLIRSVTDTGMVAVMDPRIAAGSPISYKRGTREIYDRALSHFTRRTSQSQQALTYLTGLRKAG